MPGTQRPAIIFPDVVKMLVAKIATDTGKTTGSRVPNPRPADGFYRIQRTGGPRTGPVTEDAQVTIEAQHPSAPSAERMLAEARAIVSGLEGHKTDDVTVYKVQELSGPADLPDPDSDDPRFSYTVLLQLRGSDYPSS